MKTIGSVLDSYKGIGPGFDFLRVVLAITIILHHSFLTVNGNYDIADPYKLWTSLVSPVPMFFALSGFLVSSSALRLTLKNFAINRTLRILPALIVAVALSALVVGPLATTLPLSDYYTDKKFSHYFLNSIGFIHYELPGVFLSNPFPNQVNGSVWTVPLEIGSYAIMSLLMLTGAIKSPKKLVGAIAVFTLIYSTLLIYFNSHPSPLTDDNVITNYLSNFVSPRGNYLYFYFLAGALLYAFRYQTPYSGKLALLGVVLCMCGFSGIITLGILAPLIVAFPIAYMVVYIGLLPIKKLPIYSRGDYSYGLYLYAYPLQQLLVMLFPGQFSVFTHFICSILLATAVAMLSWHNIEKPILLRRQKFSFTARKGGDHLSLPAVEGSA